MGRNSKGRLRTEGEAVSLKVRLDKDTSAKLDEASEELAVPKAEILRRGVHLVYDTLSKKGK